MSFFNAANSLTGVQTFTADKLQLKQEFMEPETIPSFPQTRLAPEVIFKNGSKKKVKTVTDEMKLGNMLDLPKNLLLKKINAEKRQKPKKQRRLSSESLEN